MTMENARSRFWMTLCALALGLLLGSHAPAAGPAIVTTLTRLPALALACRDIVMALFDRLRQFWREWGVQGCADGI